MLQDTFMEVLKQAGIPFLEQPVFYHAPVGIRFAIGGDEEVYQQDFTPNPLYVSGALSRAVRIYNHLPAVPDLLCIDLWPNEKTEGWRERIAGLCAETELPQPDECQCIADTEEGGEQLRLRLFWNLRGFSFSPESLLEKIILADIGGCKLLVSNVYFVDSQNAVLFHLYDDRGADLIAADREILRPIFERFCNWILEYNRERIEAAFLK